MSNSHHVRWAKILGSALSLAAMTGNAWAQQAVAPAGDAPPSRSPEPVAATTPPPAGAAEAPATAAPATAAPATAAPATAAPATAAPAEPVPAAENRLPTIALDSPPPPPPLARTYRYHDGFYLRVNAGLGYLLDANVHNPDQLPDLDGEGTSLDIDVMVGGSPSPGMAIGGALLLSSIASADYEAGGETLEADTNTGMLGPFIDGYPSPSGGFHVGGALGLAKIRSDKQAVTGYEDATGFGFAGWLGYDAWIGDQWSMGGLVRLLGTRAKGDTDYDGDASLSTVNLSLMLTAVYH